MAIDPVAASSANSAAQLNGVGLQDFLKILTTQLSNQDPLKPLDNQEFIAQVAQFSALEQSRQLNQKIDQLLSLQSTVQSVGLLGRMVELDAGTGTVSGQVTTLDLSREQPQFTVLTAGGASLTGVTIDQFAIIH